MIRLENISLSLGGRSILSSVSFEAEPGTITALIGPNGAGKTTTLRTIYGELMAQSGSVFIEEKPFDPSRKELIAVMSEQRSLFDHFTVKDYLNLYTHLYPRFNRNYFVKNCSKHNFNPEDSASRYSMGMKTLLLGFLTLASGAPVLLFDEPVQHLDPLVRNKLTTMISQQAENGATIVISSHEIYELEEIASHCALMKEGSILYSGDIDQAKASHRIVETIQENDNVIGRIDDKHLIETLEDRGHYPTLKEFVIGYLSGRNNSKIR